MKIISLNSEHTETPTPDSTKKKSSKKTSSRTAPPQNRAPRRALKKRRPLPRYTTSGPEKRESAIDRFRSLLRFNITFKLTVGYGIRLIALLLFIALSAYTAFSFYLFHTGIQKAELELETLSAYLDAGYAYDAPEIQQQLENKHLELFIYDMTGTFLYTNSNRHLEYTVFELPQELSLNHFPSLPPVYAATLSENALKKPTYRAIVRPLSEERALIETSLPIAGGLFMVLALSFIHAAWRMANRQLNPVHVITEDIREISARSLSKRLNIKGTKDELKDLAATFNQMLDDIQNSYDRERQFVSDASHELRTPIAVIKGYAAMLNRWGKNDAAILDESIQAIIGETENMHSLVESLLFIARNDKGTLSMDKACFDFSELLSEIVKETGLIDTGHTLTHQITPHLMLYGAPDKIKQAIRIFIDNSIKYTPEGGEIALSLFQSGDPEHGKLVLRIADNGIGISEADLPYIFERFYRADKSRSRVDPEQRGGTGLGLSIAKIIVEQHGGEINVRSTLGTGTTFTLTLPSVQ